MNLLSVIRRGRAIGKALVGRILPAAEPVKTAEAKPPSPERSWQCQGMTFLARTRSEARAKIKTHFGYKRVPVGMMITLLH